MWGMIYYFPNLLRPISERATKPDPSSTSEMGSGTCKSLSPLAVWKPTIDFVAMLDVKVLCAESSREEYPTLPKKIIRINKIINIFFTNFSFYENPCGILRYLWCRWMRCGGKRECKVV
jgi:hypothetical protein